jgi:hypothetical protein
MSNFGATSIPAAPVELLSVDRVRRAALHIAKTLPSHIDLKIVELAALFHDVAGKPPGPGWKRSPYADYRQTVRRPFTKTQD